jgi:type II secretory pathway pseudopilin PulG
MLVSVMILTLAVTALLSVSAGSATSVRSAKNKIIANWLAQESVDYVRNTRDTALIQNTDPAVDWWSPWIATLGAPGTKCFSTAGCYVDITTVGDATGIPSGFISCSSICPKISYQSYTGRYAYTYSSADAVASPFIVTVYATLNTTYDMVDISAKVTWKEGTGDKSVTQSTVLSSWQL